MGAITGQRWILLMAGLGANAGNRLDVDAARQGGIGRLLGQVLGASLAG